MRISPDMSQRAAVTLMWAMTICTLGVLLFIIAYILAKGLPYVSWEFLSEAPRSMGREGGIFPMIVGTILVCGLAVAIAAPIGLVTAIYLTEYTREGKLTAIIRFGADCLAGIPSIIFGLFGFVFFVITLGMGYSILAGALTLAVMVLPTIIRTSEEAIRAVPRSYRDVSFGLGSTRWQMVTRVVLRSALPGIGTGIVLSIGRAISETAAVMLTAGSALRLPRTVFDSSRTLSLHFYVLVREGLSSESAYGTAAILIVSILIINILAYWFMKRFVAKVR
ncbi:MAG: Phosphate transport system permease protein PstA [Planctomycetes bacterium ADurb.Bin126]|nr:MAG: Phosphate transport system permease protein PstA [Planctomycetes bacterium ADurb.Bin126]HOD84345.1 phosphate ABC transporter permease PstA [Phycisphaerae bacterium]HQL73706.1 phosphate ABC transporter permease PstA [Phycisphaerae bacterium]